MMPLPVPFPAVTHNAKLNRQWNGGARLEDGGTGCSPPKPVAVTTLAAA